MVKLRDPNPLLSDGSIDLNQWLERVSDGRMPDEKEFINKACLLAKKAGAETLTSLGDTCLNQGLVMAEILHDLGLDVPSIVASIIYPSSRYANLSLAAIREVLGEEIEKLVIGVQKIDQVSVNHPPRRQVENLRRMLLSIVEDIRVVLIKLASHTCEMRIAVHLENAIKQQMAEETQEIYAPLANRLGIGQIKWELEDLAFRSLEPTQYKDIAKLLDERRLSRDNYINLVINEIIRSLRLGGVEATVSGRSKHIYSIWKKMQRKGVGYHEIYDVRAIRIIVSTLRECYEALGTIHGLWQPIPKEFDDYIANPKENGYRSLHTAVIGPEGKTLEVQIRTPDMHNQAELGVAAHWRYKENVHRDVYYESKLASLRQIIKWQEEWAVYSESEFDETLRAEVFQDRVYVLTPKGEVLDLLQGATVLDFAYHVHTEIGNRCRGAKVNGQMTPLTHVVKSGDKVEILTAKTGGPSRDWLNRDLGFLKTNRARAKALQWFRKQDREQNIPEGREVLERELKRLGIENLSLDALAQQLKIAKVEDMLAALGGGDIRLTQVLGAIQALIQPTLPKITNMPVIEPKVHYRQERSAEILVSGVGNLLCQMAKCCKPVPGEEITGYITVGKGVTVHRKDCINVLHARQHKINRLIQVEWGLELKNQYLADIGIRAYDREGLLRDISSILSSERVNVIAVNTLSNKGDNTADFKFTLEISGVKLLSKVLNRIQQLPNVIEAKRILF
jgi:GTP pyrophosphokinase